MTRNNSENHSVGWTKVGAKQRVNEDYRVLASVVYCL